jgi:hypothetical protein
VELDSKNALGFAQLIADLQASEFDFLGTPTVFGDKVRGPKGNWARPGLWTFGQASLTTTFIIPAKGAILPDWLDVVFDAASYAPATFELRSATAGVPSNPGCLLVHQVAEAGDGDIEFTYTTETVEIDPNPCAEVF